MLICGIVFTPPSSRYAAKEGGWIVQRIDPQPDAAIFQRVTFFGDEVLDGAHWAFPIRRTDQQIAEMKPKLMRTVSGQRNGDRDRVCPFTGLLQNPDPPGTAARCHPRAGGLQ